MSTSVTISAEEFARMRFESPTELVRGEFLSIGHTALAQGAVCANVAFELEKWNRATSAGIVATNDTGVQTEWDPDTVRGADVLFVSTEKLPQQPIAAGLMQAVPDLCVEVLSPSDRWGDVLGKVGEYLSAGVAEVWVADPEQRTVQVFRPEQPPESFDSDDELKTESVLPGFACRVADLFQGI